MLKFTPKHLIATGLLAALGFTAVAQTAPPATPPAAGAREAHPGKDSARMHERMQKHMERRLGALKQKLQLSPTQEGAWGQYTAALKPTSMQRPDRAEISRLTTPERIDRMRTLRAARMAEMDKRADATKSFYAALSPEQKKVFDQESLKGHRGGERGRHHGGHHQG
jgi:Spy/CpxP family protein refolding chaperone